MDDDQRRMDRLSRAENQRRTRARVLDAARAEFTECGYRDAKIDAIADRAGLTRGGVYSNFPGKRALYFAVLAEDAGRPPLPPSTPPGRTAREALGVFARGWLARLPLMADEPHSPARLGADLLPEVLADERTRVLYVQLMRLSAVLLGRSLELLHPPAGRRVGVAGSVLTQLHGASQLAAVGWGFVEEFTVVAACERLAGLDPERPWLPPHLAHTPRARPTDEPWAPPTVHDAIRDEPWSPGDGIVTVVGLHRLAMIEEAVRSAPAGTPVTAVLVTGAPDELSNLARLVLADLLACLRPAFPPAAWPDVRLVHDPAGELAAAAGVAAVSDATEAAIRLRAGRIVARAEGFGAGHAAASA
ncbi:TetR/AcrR family transcriptional regulator [Dactylosporangium sp. CA-092794]|uniref:TetR/AcrR family transcriptional regulator n=1 Tax=Dactylosporangium sp. CA-092794 TaxID=3239929 RepID=UPI003D924A15